MAIERVPASSTRAISLDAGHSLARNGTRLSTVPGACLGQRLEVPIAVGTRWRKLAGAEWVGVEWGYELGPGFEVDFGECFHDVDGVWDVTVY